MSLDNAIAIAAAAHGDTTLIVLGLLISIPLIIFGATLIMMLLNRFPIIVVAGGGLLGWIAGEVIATDPAYAEKLAAVLPNAKTIFEIGGAVITVALGYALQYRARNAPHAEPVDLAKKRRATAQGVSDMAQIKAILVPVDGSENSDRAVQHALELVAAGLAADAAPR